MDNNIAIEFQHVGKQYRLGRVGTTDGGKPLCLAKKILISR